MLFCCKYTHTFQVFAPKGVETEVSELQGVSGAAPKRCGVGDTELCWDFSLRGLDWCSSGGWGPLGLPAARRGDRAATLRSVNVCGDKRGRGGLPPTLRPPSEALSLADWV